MSQIVIIPSAPAIATTLAVIPIQPVHPSPTDLVVDESSAAGRVSARGARFVRQRMCADCAQRGGVLGVPCALLLDGSVLLLDGIALLLEIPTYAHTLQHTFGYGRRACAHAYLFRRSISLPRLNPAMNASTMALSRRPAKTTRMAWLRAVEAILSLWFSLFFVPRFRINTKYH